MRFAKLELTPKISALPDDARPVKNDWTRSTVQDEASAILFFSSPLTIFAQRAIMVDK